MEGLGGLRSRLLLVLLPTFGLVAVILWSSAASNVRTERELASSQVLQTVRLLAFELEHFEQAPAPAANVAIEPTSYERVFELLSARELLPDDLTVLLLDEQLIVLDRYPPRPDLVGLRLLDTPLGRGLGEFSDSPVFEGVGLDGTPRLYAKSAVQLRDQRQALLVAGIPRATAADGDATVQRTAWIALLLGGFATVVILAGAEVFIRRPLLELIDAAQRISGGDLDARIKLRPGVGELGTLARAIDVMATATQQREALKQHELQESQKAAASERFLLTSVPGHLWTTDTDLRMRFVARQHHEGLPEVIGRHIDDVLPPNDPGLDAHRRALAGEAVTFESGFAGRQFIARVEPLQEPEGAIIGCIGVAMDVTKVRRGEVERLGLLQAVERQREELRALSRRLLQAQESERARLSHVLHDDVGQALTALKIDLHQVKDDLATSTLAHRLDVSISMADRALQRVRNLALDLRPAILDHLGLRAATRWYARRFAERMRIDVDVHDGTEVSLPGGVQTACFRILQEALTNAARHSGATRVDIFLAGDRDRFEMRIRDNGRGFEVDAAKARAAAGESLGLLSMEERAVLAGGEVDMKSGPGGSEISACFRIAPVPAS